MQSLDVLKMEDVVVELVYRWKQKKKSTSREWQQ